MREQQDCDLLQCWFWNARDHAFQEMKHSGLDLETPADGGVVLANNFGQEEARNTIYAFVEGSGHLLKGEFYPVFKRVGRAPSTTELDEVKTPQHQTCDTRHATFIIPETLQKFIFTRSQALNTRKATMKFPASWLFIIT